MRHPLLFVAALALTAACTPEASEPPPPGGDAGPPAAGLDDTMTLAELQGAQLVTLCEEDEATRPVGTVEQECALDALFEAMDAATCATARDACVMEAAGGPGGFDCAAAGPQIQASIAGCTATVADYRACRAALDAADRTLLERADCMYANDLDGLFAGIDEQPAACQTLWAACPNLNGEGG